ncbi:hypothetical protein CISIN_1g0130991mg [Citrus sinensis]|uniref:Uncharacterized protein n=1 Tax=Citrus sinensis TaxID=2711 RepID=A0A067DER5_CITSI|nr:hypothetical protein CISIN_1g0130991mg [Citrus sinensis]
MSSLNAVAYFTAPQLSFSTRRRSRRHRRHLRNDNNNSSNTYNPLSKPSSFDGENINLVLDFHQISILSSSSKSKLHRFLSSAEQAYADLKTVITLDDNGRLLVSCRKSTLQFVGGVLLSGFVLVFVFRVLVKLGLGFSSRFRFQKQNFVVRRDRSLGGKEVVVAVGRGDDDARLTRNLKNRVLDNPLSEGRDAGSALTGRVKRSYRVQRMSEGKLPKWWSVQVSADRTLVVDKEEYQREANRLIRAIIDQRTRGQDIPEDDIYRLRRICRISGVRVSIDTINTRDSLYRTSVDYVLNACSRALSNSTTVEIDGEDAREFITGLADNIGLENIRAARMVSAAVAARTRSCFLQAWPELEMVARGLEKLLKFEQREILMNMLTGVCSEESHRSAAEALGLLHVLSREGNDDQHEESINRY